MIASVNRLASAARILRGARNGLNAAIEKARVAALDAIADGATEVEVAKALGVNRMTVRKWQGKL